MFSCNKKKKSIYPGKKLSLDEIEKKKDKTSD